MGQFILQIAAVWLIVRPSDNVRIKTVDSKLVSIVSKGHDWFTRLSSGRCTSIQEIAQAEKVSSQYVTRVIYLAFLAPDIVQRIVCGDHPADLTGDRLIRMVPFPSDWEAQRVLLGLTT